MLIAIFGDTWKAGAARVISNKDGGKAVWIYVNITLSVEMFYHNIQCLLRISPSLYSFISMNCASHWFQLSTNTINYLSKEVGKQSSELQVTFTRWRVVCDFTSHHNKKCEAILNEVCCVSFHHNTIWSVRLYSMKGAVWVSITSQLDM